MEKRLKVQVWISYERKKGERVFLLLQTRPERGGFWQPVTGSVEKGESLHQAAQREVLEETGIKGAVRRIEAAGGTFGYVKSGKEYLETGFAVEVSPHDLGSAAGGQELPTVRIDRHEHVAYQWVTAEEAMKRAGFESNACVLAAYLEEQALPVDARGTKA